MKHKVKNLRHSSMIVHENGHGTHSQRRWVENTRCPVGTDGTTIASTQDASVGMPQSTSGESERHERHLLRASDGLPMERAERDRHLQQFVGSSAIHRVDRSRSVPRVLDLRAVGVSGSRRHRLELAVDGRRNDESTTGRGKKQVPIRRIERSAGQSAACSRMGKESPSASWSMAPIGTTLGWSSLRLRASRLSAQNRRDPIPRIWPWTKGMTIPRLVNWFTNLDSPRTSAPEEKRLRRSRNKLDTRPVAGLWKGHTVG